MTCIQVDDTNYCRFNWNGTHFKISPFSKYSLNCGIGICEAKFGKIQPMLGQVTLLDSTVGNNLKYSWYFGDGNSSISYLPTHTYASAGSYNVCLLIQDTIGGCADYFCDSITVDSLGLLRNSWTINVVRNIVGIVDQSISISDLTIYPNPTTDLLYLNFEKNGSYKLLSIDGKQVSKTKKLTETITSIDVSNLQTGIYVLTIISDNGEVITRRIVKN